jgi:predicted amidophosphoribosyltransferase
MQAGKVTNILSGNLAATNKRLHCSNCNHALCYSDKSCERCGKVLNSRELRALAEQQWANDMRPLKFYIPLSASLALGLLWALSISLT